MCFDFSQQNLSRVYFNLTFGCIYFYKNLVSLREASVLKSIIKSSSMESSFLKLFIAPSRVWAEIFCKCILYTLYIMYNAVSNIFCFYHIVELFSIKKCLQPYNVFVFLLFLKNKINSKQYNLYFDCRS